MVAHVHVHVKAPPHKCCAAALRSIDNFFGSVFGRNADGFTKGKTASVTALKGYKVGMRDANGLGAGYGGEMKKRTTKRI